MALKPNYRFERTQRERSRESKKQEKQRRREEASSQRKAAQTSNSSAETAGETDAQQESENLDLGNTPAKPRTEESG